MKPTLAIYGIKDRNAGEFPAYVHDHNLCLMQDGKIIQYLQLERYSRRKYDNRLDLFLEDLVDKKLLHLPKEFTLVSVNNWLGNAFISKSGRIRLESNKLKQLNFKCNDATAFYQEEKWKGNLIEDSFIIQHEVAHICSNLPFYGEFKDNSLLLSIDGGSSLGNYAAFIYKKNKFELIENNWSDLGFASKLFNDNALSFRILNAGPGSHCSVPGKLMGFACFGKADQEIEKWLFKNEFFKDYWQKENDILTSIKQIFNVDSFFSTKDRFMQNIAATMQKIFENAVLFKIRNLQEKYQADYLYYGGGCALNIVTNSLIVESGLFKDVFIAPCCNDSGLSIGAACFIEHLKRNKIALHNAYINNVACDLSSKYKVLDFEIERVANLLLENKVVGICNGFAEAGPRALGNRSLIARPDSKELSCKLSVELKKREWFRPIAPIMLREMAEKVTIEKLQSISKYMLMDFNIKDEYKKQLEGVIHVNGTARIQIIEKEEDNPFMYRLLKRLEKEGDIALVNSSFNVAGEPIVHTSEDAEQSARQMNLDGLVLNGKLLLKGEF